MSLRFSYVLLAALCGLAFLASSVHHLSVMLLGTLALLILAVWRGRRRVPTPSLHRHPVRTVVLEAARH
ncbi:hypothetical protein [Deinococcus altitudinis]|uniref:hypothetical protein n=1 Tax=Deinococcus altitudinis TaxID=468914 RepID=UPI0038912D7E